MHRDEKEKRESDRESERETKGRRRGFVSMWNSGRPISLHYTLTAALLLAPHARARTHTHTHTHTQIKE